MFHVNSVSKSYSSFPAISEVSFALEDGDVLGLLGLNGAGKSTLLKGLAGVLPFSSGEVSCDCVSLSTQPHHYRALLGYQPERPCLPPLMTVCEFGKFIGSLHGLSRKLCQERLLECFEFLALHNLAHVPCGELSKGEQQRVGFLAAIVHRPKLLLLDEPMSGLDPKQMLEFRTFIRSERESRVTLLSTHLLHEIQAVCNKLLILHEGRVVAFKEELTAETLSQLERYFIHAVPENADQMVSSL